MRPIAYALELVAGLAACKAKQERRPAPPAGSGRAEAATVQPVVRPSQQPLPPLPPLDLPPDPRRAQKVALGHELFFDKRLSANDDASCYSCHQNADGTGGHDKLAIASGGKPLARHAPTIWNVAYYKDGLSWDGHAPTLIAQAKGAWAGPMGIGADNLDKKADAIARLPGYRKLFDDAGFTKVNADAVAEAIAAYEDTLICKDTAYDRFAAGDKAALTEQQQRGLDLFLGKAACNGCHQPPFFSSAMGAEHAMFYNVGIGTAAPDDKIDTGRMLVTNNPADWGAFKPPSLRNVARSAPYFHDGSVATLDDAVKLMASGGIKNKNRSPSLTDRGLTDPERADLVAFLGALTCPQQLDPPPPLLAAGSGAPAAE
jgi:cytochrome c peroxidase